MQIDVTHLSVSFVRTFPLNDLMIFCGLKVQKTESFEKQVNRNLDEKSCDKSENHQLSGLKRTQRMHRLSALSSKQAVCVEQASFVLKLSRDRNLCAQ